MRKELLEFSKMIDDQVEISDIPYFGFFAFLSGFFK